MSDHPHPGPAMSTTTAARYVVGQMVWVVYSERWHRDTGRNERIAKVGTRWAHLENGGRFDIAKGFLDGHGFSSPGSVYLSESEYREEQKRAEAWRRFTTDVRDLRDIPAHLTTDDIARIHASVMEDRP